MAIKARPNGMNTVLKPGERLPSEDRHSPFAEMFSSVAPENDNFGCLDSEPERRPTGLVLQATETGEGRIFEIVLLYPQTQHSKVIASYHDDIDVIADWRHIGAELQLPLYIMNAIGQLEPANFDTPATFRIRRLGSPLSGRRPRFLRNRKEGQPCLMATVFAAATSANTET